MKRLIWAAVFVSMAIFNGTTAHADLITGTISGDDNISYWNGSSWVAEGTNWQTPETINLNVDQSSEMFYFAVSNNNWYPGGDPAGFLASFTDNTGTFTETDTNTFLTSVNNWQALASSQWTATPGPFSSLSDINPSVDPTTLSGWVTPTSFGVNGSNQWGVVNGGPLSDIDPNAQWIWTANNTSENYSTTDDYDFFRVNLGTVVTPEPSTLWLFALGGVLMVFLLRKRTSVLA